MRAIPVILTLSLFLGWGCKKDTIITEKAPVSPPTSTPDAPVTTLVLDTIGTSQVKVNMFHPPIAFNDNYTYYLDIDSDSLPDFRIVMQTDWSCGGMNPHMKMRFAALNPNSFVLTDSVFKINYYTVMPNVFDHSVTNDSLFVRKLHLHDTIHVENKFRSGNIFMCEQAYMYCGVGTGMSWADSTWGNTADVMIALKFKNRLGWIRMEKNKIYGYAISK